MKALFFAMAMGSFGETLIGESLARQVASRGVESQFVIEPISEKLLADSGFVYHVLHPEMGPLAQSAVDGIVGEFGPDVLVLSDYFLFSEVFKYRFGLDPWFIDRYRLPILPIDIWEWESTSFEMDFFADFRYQVSRRIERLGTRLRPAPLCHLHANGDDALVFKLLEGEERVSNRMKQDLRKTFGIPGDCRVVLLTASRWQLRDMDDDDGNRVARFVPELVSHYLGQLPQQTHFVVAGEPPPGLALPEERTHFVPPCAPARFNLLVGSVDLFVTLNISATTLVRATLADVPGIVLMNSHSFKTPAEREDVLTAVNASRFVRSWAQRLGRIYPFRVWPIGFHELMEPMLRDNEYTTAIAQAELLDEDSCLDLMRCLLFDETTRSELAEARNAYCDRLAALEDTGSLFARAVGAASC